MSHSAKKLRNRLPLLLVLFGLIGCATPRAQLNQEILQLSKTKIPLTVAIIFSPERRARVWQPDFRLQGLVPRPVYPGNVLAETLVESMNLIFERAFIIENEEEAVIKEVSAFVTIENYISTWTPEVLSFKDNNLISHIKININDLNNKIILSIYENGIYDHTWTAIDDGAIQRASIDAFNKVLPKIVQSEDIMAYVEAMKKIQSLTNIKQKIMMPRQKASYEINANYNYIDAPYYGMKKRIFVTDFNVSDELKEITNNRNIGQGAFEILIRELLKTGRFIVIERKILQNIINGQYLEETDLVRKETATVHKSGAQVTITGVISKFDEKQYGGGKGFAYKDVSVGLKESTARMTVGIRLTDSVTGQLLGSHDAIGQGFEAGLNLGISKKDVKFDFESFQKTPLAKATSSALFDAIRFIISKVDDVPFEVKVIMTKGADIYINAGSLVNIQVGDRLLAYLKSNALVAEESLVGTLEVTEVEDKFSVGHFVHGKGKLKRGDTIRFYQ